jgi:uncharacterized membrane protein
MNLPSEQVRRKLKITMREKLRHHFSSIADTVIIIIIIIIIYLVNEVYFHGTLTLCYVRMTAHGYLGKVICLVIKLATHTDTVFVGLGQDVFKLRLISCQFLAAKIRARFHGISFRICGGKVALGQVCVRALCLSLSVSFHQCFPILLSKCLIYQRIGYGYLS